MSLRSRVRSPYGTSTFDRHDELRAPPAHRLIDAPSCRGGRSAGRRASAKALRRRRARPASATGGVAVARRASRGQAGQRNFVRQPCTSLSPCASKRPPTAVLPRALHCSRRWSGRPSTAPPPPPRRALRPRPRSGLWRSSWRRTRTSRTGSRARRRRRRRQLLYRRSSSRASASRAPSSGRAAPGRAASASRPARSTPRCTTRRSPTRTLSSTRACCRPSRSRCRATRRRCATARCSSRSSRSATATPARASPRASRRRGCGASSTASRSAASSSSTPVARRACPAPRAKAST